MLSGLSVDRESGFDKIYGLVDKLGAPVNKLTNKLGSEAFWPTTLDKESDKAARILRSFCSEFYLLYDNKTHVKDGTWADGYPEDGFYQDEKLQHTDGPTAKQRVVKKIPAEVSLPATDRY